VHRGLVILLASLCLVSAGCGGSSKDAVATTDSTTTTSAPAPGPDGCTDVAVPAARKDGGEKAPTERLDPEQTTELVVKTNCGTFTITLDIAGAPATAASLVSLAGSGFYDNTIFHRIVPDFVIQGGDPTQTGTGGPGYQTVDPPPAAASYTKGVVAMAKTQTEKPGTAGSQFFVVTGADIGLPPDYAIVGKVTGGLDVVTRIGRLGDATTQQPTRPVVIESVKVVKR
jgi:peptidyl-prolyl cis-trans isomerase B (cyclophilin B)